MDELLGSEVFDYVIVGSGFGGSVSAMRLAEKGYSVCILEQGMRFEDHDFARSNWNIWKYLWAPVIRCFGIQQISLFKNVVVLHFAGVGGGSLGYANVLMRPSDIMFRNPSWKHLADWKTLLAPHYLTAERMLGVVENPCFHKSDQVLKEISAEKRAESTFQPTRVGVYFGQPGITAPDPYFGGAGPSRRGCTQCGGCMVGCRENSKNSLEKNYLFFAEKGGAKILPGSRVRDVVPISSNKIDDARYLLNYESSTAWFFRRKKHIQARNVIFSAGSLGTLELLFRCRELTRSLPAISTRLGMMMRTNSEALLGSVAKDRKLDYSEGVAITSIFYADETTTIEPVRYPAGSSLMRFLSGPLLEGEGNVFRRSIQLTGKVILHPVNFLKTHILPGWAQRSTILLVMQTIDNHFTMKLGRSPLALFQKRLVSVVNPDQVIPGRIAVGHDVTYRFAEKTKGIPLGTLNEGILNIPMTAHILGGCPFGRNDQEGVVGLNCEVFNYPGLFVIDGSIMPANPGVNPSLTIAALAEYAMSLIPEKSGLV